MSNVIWRAQANNPTEDRGQVGYQKVNALNGSPVGTLSGGEFALSTFVDVSPDTE